ncbi:uncharacterized protein Z520_02733 [Fonsecaea multimorphosa CBS 102226]|uniref:Uncharacterized protein n=1 Tax=Fonsecaea multimorphosa CBS 102226 TaxID=1442371 RepID=A0A0D2HGX3_9EURO|nr:uncharacterized protein Z520_02733 [Fonsecaea multimorphosa CBS 102226]KIY01181.1 hypothetical protein Z520_02733 [Fonsecaea multimorphosa CBS 102226]OAL28794.1 hypothetical protein AYO22_02659 [Fonsecaea multimorphosa]
MSSTGLKRVSLGETAALGSLYDARTDSFLALSLMNGSLPEPAVTREACPFSRSSVVETHDLKYKFNAFGVEPHLGASLLSGLIVPSGSAASLLDRHESNFNVQMSLQHVVTTFRDKVNFTSPELQQYISRENIQLSHATHVVSEITWGNRSILTANYQRSAGEDEGAVRRLLREEYGKVEQNISDHETLAADLHRFRDLSKSLRVHLHTDLSESNPIQIDLKGACQFLRNMPNHLLDVNEGRGQPVIYMLLPVQWLSLILSFELTAENMIVQPSEDHLQDYMKMFEGIRGAQRRLEDYWNYLSLRRALVPEEHVREVSESLDRARKAEDVLRVQYGNALRQLRNGRTGLKQLAQELDKFANDQYSPVQLSAVADIYARKLAFIDQATTHGANYFSNDGAMPTPRGDVYTLYFSGTVMDDNATWGPNSRLLFNLLQERNAQKSVRIVDCDRSGRPIKKSNITFHRDGNLVTNDFKKLQDFLGDKCLMHFEDTHLDTWGVKKPIDRKPVRLPCPGRNCEPRAQHQWICSRCYSTIDYGKRDHYLYCDCGRTKYRYWSFRCNAQCHGPNFERREDRQLLQLLDAMDPFEEVNILILGETGVGKSTWINAFVNYLTHSTLQEAMDATQIEHVIACSFATQTIDEHDPHKRLIQRKIQIGVGDEFEHDASDGHSATQKAVTYPIFVDSVMVRLIDTPGIGDTRGLDQDKANMADVLSVLSNYKELHGILILLKPNNSRLNVMFEFCIKELLTHLHRNAARNMVFGFTNTRGSNYHPGDTFIPLEAVLKQFRDVNLGLFHDTVYCFDSESFRYLAAHKQQVNLGSYDDYFRSWEQSATESRRLLDYIRQLEPHQTENTLSLNEARRLILQLTKPMAEIAQKINDTIELNQRDNELLRNSKLSKDEMLKKLDVQQNSVVFSPVTRPKTVCTNARCIEKVDTPGPNGEDTIHKRPCHNPCCLTNVPVEKVGTPELVRCAAFAGSQHCKGCRHHWTEHKHILYEHRETKKTIKDPKVEMLLQDNAKVTTVIEAAIRAKEATIAEFRHEHREIQRAAVQFSLWLKHHSITPYNDATLEYLDHLIKEEKSKVAIGGKRQRLDAFEQYRREYKELVNLFESNLDQGRNEELLDATGVDKLVKQLYSLKHYGADLRKLRDTVVIAHNASIRERPYRVNVRRGVGISVIGRSTFQTSIRTRAASNANDKLPSISRKPVPSALAMTDEKQAVGTENEANSLAGKRHVSLPEGNSSAPPPSYFEAAVAPRNLHERTKSKRRMARSLSGRLTDKVSSIFR